MGENSSKEEKNDKNQQTQEVESDSGGGLKNKLKNKAKNGIKNMGQKIKEAFKNGIKALWKVLPIHIKIIVVVILLVILLCACFLIVLTDNAVASSNDTISSYYNSYSNSSSKAAKKYKEEGSLVLMNDEDNKNIAQEYIDGIEGNNLDLSLYMRTVYENGDPENGGVPLKEGALSINEEKTLYEHILNSERYNFNKIKWTKYVRDENKGLLPLEEMQVDSETRLQYPKDSNGTSFDTFINDMTPYLQNWIIPYGLYAGIYASGEENVTQSNKQFAYQLLLNGYHEITVNQYNLQIETEVTAQNVYDVFQYTVVRTRKRNGDGTESVTTNYVKDKGLNYKLLESCKQGPKTIIEGPTITYDIKYCLSYARMFDRVIKDDYVVQKYDRNVTIPEIYLTRTSYIDGEEIPASNLNQMEDSVFIPTSEATIIDYKSGTVNEWTGVYTYVVTKGYTQVEKRVWKDKLDLTGQDDREFNIDDVEDAIAPSKLSADEKAYYNSMINNRNVDRLNLFDIINAKEEIYSKYLANGERYSQNIGYTRSKLMYSYDSIKRFVENIQNWMYLYGESLGLHVKSRDSKKIGDDIAIIRDFDASGVVKAMQDVYTEFSVKNKAGYSWNQVQLYESNADHAWTKWKSTIEEIAPNYGVNPLYILSIMCMESQGGKYSGYGTGTAAGPMQIEKKIHLDNVITANNVKTGKKDSIIMTREALGDDKTNIQIGIMMYANHLKACNDNPYLAAQKYNYGNINFVNTYAQRVGKDKNSIIADVDDVGWVYESMKYHCDKNTGDGYYAYKFAMYLEYLKSKKV